MKHPSRSSCARTATACCAWVAFGVVLATAAAGLADGPGVATSFPIDDADPESSVPSAQEAISRPLHMGYWVMLVSDRAEAAMARGDHAAAVKYFRALAKAVPERSVSFAKICAAYDAMGDWDNAVTNCKTALGKAGVKLDDYVHFVRLVLAKPKALGSAEIADLDASIAHLEVELGKTRPAAAATETGQPRDAAGSQLLVQQLRCELGARLEDARRLEACTRALSTLAPDDPRTIAFGWALALAKQDWDEAEQVVGRARRVGLARDAVERMESKLRSARDRASGLPSVIGGTRGAIAFGLVALLASAVVLGRRKLRLRTT